jgi:5-formyltetrahydrofolate cyclo-ligase
MMKEKKALRTEALRHRSALSPGYRQEASEAIGKHISEWNLFLEAESIGLYAHYGSEVSTQELISLCFALGKEVSLPRTHETQDGLHMDFYRIESFQELQPGFKGILEPSEELGLPRVSPSFLMVPGLVFSRRGDRLGYGAGTYDRYLSRRNPMPFRLALSFDAQIVTSIPSGPQDIPMNAIVTESGIRHCTQPIE